MPAVALTLSRTMKEKSDLHIHVRPAQVVKVLGGAIAILVVCSFIGSFAAHVLGHGRLLGFVSEFDVNAENNVPTYFSSFLLLTAAALLAVIAYAQTPASSYRWHWIGLVIIFLFFSLDETASLHERLAQPLRSTLETGGLLYYAWVIPGIAFILLFGLAYFRFWFRLPARSRRLFMLAGIIYISGALGLELVGGWYVDLYERDFIYALLTIVEETLEMAGVAVFIYALLTYIGQHISPLSFYVLPNHRSGTEGGNGASPRASMVEQAEPSGYDRGASE